ncbi:hypothetical protein [Terricaulis sp.]|uniref:hypothetical protein n=1 Tax=Terricaulis sp. TaxID=2768686 RepID=UPI00378432D3
MSTLHRRALLSALLAAGVTPAWAQAPEFAVGQVWSVRNLSGGLATIGRIEPYARGTAIHISLTADTPLQLQGQLGPTMQISHLPVASEAFARSVETLQQTGGTPDPHFEDGYAQWRAAQGGVWTVDIAEIYASVTSLTPAAPSK